MKRKLDALRSSLTIYTSAGGLLGDGALSFLHFAHDLKLTASELEGEADGDEPAIVVSTKKIKVEGLIQEGKLEKSFFSKAEREKIEGRIRDLFGGPEIFVRGALRGGRASIDVTTVRGGTRVDCDVETTEDGGRRGVRGATKLSLKTLGLPPITGALGMYRVKDEVRVEFDLLFR